MIQFNSAYLTRKDKKIFDNFNLSIKKNEKILIQGKSGIGKTTFFKVLLGFESLDKGRATFNGWGISKGHIKDIRGSIFYLSQDIDLKNELVRNLLEEIREHNPASLLHKDLQKKMAFLELSIKILDQNVKELSGGERQRLGLLIGFLLDRPVWLLDEPTSALDDPMKKKIADFIAGRDRTIVIISHDEVWKQHPDIKIERWV